MLAIEANSQQKIDYDHFDKNLFEKVLFQVLNFYRVEKGSDKIIWSNVVYNEISIHQMGIILAKDSVFHPDLKPMWDSTRVRELISKESERLTGLKTYVFRYAGPNISIAENCLYTNFKAKTYQELAIYCVKLWDDSPNHRVTQYFPYRNKGKPGLAACAVGFSKKGMYVCFDFATVSRLGSITH